VIALMLIGPSALGWRTPGTHSRTDTRTPGLAVQIRYTLLCDAPNDGPPVAPWT
jgi:hypothetical protein